jgi:hypothetical protein
MDQQLHVQYNKNAVYNAHDKIIRTTYCDSDKYISSGPSFSHQRDGDSGECLRGWTFIDGQAGLGKIDEAIDSSCPLAVPSSPEKQSTH